MELQERFDAATAKLDELNAKMEEAKKAVKESIKEGTDSFISDMDFVSSSIDEFLEDAKREHDLKVEERIDDIIDADEKLEAKKDERLEASRLKIERLQDRINDLSRDRAKAEQEELITDLLTYADDCRENAIYMAKEAILAYKSAAEQIVIYEEKYGK